jgi:hypothetical protein
MTRSGVPVVSPQSQIPVANDMTIAVAKKTIAVTSTNTTMPFPAFIAVVPL